MSKPTHAAFVTREYEKNGQKETAWTRVGVAWPHADGKGFNIVLEALPVDGKLSLRLDEPKPQEQPT
jgi:hypothetical protein